MWREVIVLLSFMAVPAAASADAITGVPIAAGETQSASGSTSNAEDPQATTLTTAAAPAPLFDAAGATLLYVYPPQRVSLWSSGTPYGSGDSSLIAGGSGGALVPDPLLVGLTSGVSSATMANMALTSADQVAAALAASGTSSTAIPEPSLLWLVIPGLAVGLWRSTIRRHHVP